MAKKEGIVAHGQPNGKNPCRGMTIGRISVYGSGELGYDIRVLSALPCGTRGFFEG